MTSLVSAATHPPAGDGLRRSARLMQALGAQGGPIWSELSPEEAAPLLAQAELLASQTGELEPAVRLVRRALPLVDDESEFLEAQFMRLLKAIPLFSGLIASCGQQFFCPRQIFGQDKKIKIIILTQYRIRVIG